MSPDTDARHKEAAAQQREDVQTLKRYRNSGYNLGLFGVIKIHGLSIKRTVDGWKFTVRSEVDGKRFVSFVDHSDLLSGLPYALYLVGNNEAKMYTDRYNG